MALTDLSLALWSLSCAAGAGAQAAVTWRLLYRKPKKLPDDQLPPVSILRPICGVEDGGTFNNAALLNLDYPCYEVVFAVASNQDPALPALKLLLKGSKVPAKIVFGEANGVENPKVANLIKAEAAAEHDVLVVSDSNVTVTPTYLRELVPYLTEDVGVVTAVVKAQNGERLGGRVEECQMNSFVARWMILADVCRIPFVIGKSMAYRKSVAAGFGGIGALGTYLAEDYMMGFEMRALGKRVAVQHAAVHQYVGRKTLKQYFERHYRWGLLQKHSEPWAFLLEPLQFAAVLPVLAFVGLWPVSHFWAWFLAATTIGLLINQDADLTKMMGGKFNLKAWVVREALAPLIWAKALVRNDVTWRGNRLKVGRRGKVRRKA